MRSADCQMTSFVRNTEKGEALSAARTELVSIESMDAAQLHAALAENTREIDEVDALMNLERRRKQLLQRRGQILVALARVEGKIS